VPTPEEIEAAKKRLGLIGAPERDPSKRDLKPSERLALVPFRAAFEEYVEEEQRGTAGAITLGWQSIDHSMTGLGKPIRPGEVVIVGARTGIGKTWIGQHVTYRALTSDENMIALDFTMEMAAYQMAERFSGAVLGYSTRQLGERVLLGQERLEDVMAKGPWLDRLFFFEATTSIETIPRVIDLAEEQTGSPVGLVVIDYTQLLAWKGARNATLTEQATMNARQLKDVTKQRRVITIACAQLSRAGGGSGFTEPSMDALRESGAAEEAADRILMFWRAKAEDEEGQPVKNPHHEIQAKVEKNRHGPRGARAVLRYDHAMRLGEVPNYSTAEEQQQAMNEAEWNAPAPKGRYGEDIPF
jgi:replicative DNA helicase